MGDSSDVKDHKQRLIETEATIKECTEYDSNTRSESLVGAPQFIHDLFTNDKFTKNHPDQLYVDVLFDLTMWIVIGGGLVAAGILPGWLYITIKMLVFIGRFILLFHYTTHNPTSQALTWYSAWIISPFFGLPFDTYKYHHIYMHHAENNQRPWDTTTTLPYQRDNFCHFLAYWLRHAVGVSFELPYRTFMRRSAWDAFVLVAKLVSDIVLKYVLYQYYPNATLWLLIVPYWMTTGALMFGNFSQHIFVDPEKFESNMHLTYNCIGKGSLNDRIFNDGYHILHHENGKLAWNKLPETFGENWREYDDAGAFCFKGLDFFGVGVLVMTG